MSVPTTGQLTPRQEQIIQESIGQAALAFMTQSQQAGAMVFPSQPGPTCMEPAQPVTPKSQESHTLSCHLPYCLHPVVKHQFKSSFNPAPF